MNLLMNSVGIRQKTFENTLHSTIIVPISCVCVCCWHYKNNILE